MSKYQRRENPLPLLVLPFIGTLSATATAVVSLSAVGLTIFAANRFTNAMGWRQVDTAVLQSLISREDYKSLALRITTLIELLEEGHSYSDIHALSEAMGDDHTFSFYANAESPVMASLIASNYLLGGALLSQEPQSRKTLADAGIATFNDVVNKEGYATGSLNPQKAREQVAEVIVQSYEQILKTPFKNKQSKFKLLNRMGNTLDEIGIQAAQFNQSNIDLIVQEEALMAKCMGEKPYGAILAALSFKPKPICYTGTEWLVLRIASWSALLGLAGAVLAQPLKQTQILGEILGVAARQKKQISKEGK